MAVLGTSQEGMCLAVKGWSGKSCDGSLKFCNEMHGTLSRNYTHKVRSSDADIDNICDGLSCETLPLTAANFLQQTNAIIVNIMIAALNLHEPDC